MPANVIVACDFPDKAATFAFLDKLGGEKPYLKIGMELFYAEGPEVVRQVKARGHQVFLDLKLHDIPNTVHRAMKNLAKLGVDMTNLHAGGGSAMMRAALEGLAEGAQGARPLLLAVTQLTSTSEQTMHAELLIPGKIAEVVGSYASTAHSAGLDGVVCSPLETGLVKEWCGKDFLTVTPGIRYPDAQADDQQRVTTPQMAAQMGCDYIVVGRPVTAAADPAAAYRQVVRDFLGDSR